MLAMGCALQGAMAVVAGRSTRSFGSIRMNIAAGLMLGFFGFSGGMLLFSRAFGWIATAWEAGRPKQESGRNHFSLALAASVSAFHSGPWLLVASGIFAYYTRAEPWWPWIFGGAIVGLIYPAALIAQVMRRRGRHAA